MLMDNSIVIGNHRDAWIVGGAGDPNSGSAVLNEVIRSFGEALKLGWKPLRTVVFASWDGEEYGLVGSTEWVEEYLPWLSKANVAYLVRFIKTPCILLRWKLTAMPEHRRRRQGTAFQRTCCAPAEPHHLRRHFLRPLPQPNRARPDRL